MGSEAPELLKPVEEFVFLRHAPCVTLSEEWLTEPHPRGYVGEPPEPWWLGAHLLVPGAKDWAQASVDREPEARASPEQRRR
jgi:hypothetical protein